VCVILVSMDASPSEGGILTLRIGGNISSEATLKFGSIFREAMRHTLRINQLRSTGSTTSSRIRSVHHPQLHSKRVIHREKDGAQDME